jgi:EmrB/QacA subfamily drug resistance transporter
MPYKWRTLLVVCFGTYMATMDFSIVNVALPILSQEFNRSPDVVIWATLASNLTVTGLTLTAGRVGDLWGRKRIYVMGWVIFTTGMALATFAQSIEQLIATRFLQAIGVSMAIATGNAIITAAFPDHERGRALGIGGAMVGAGLMSGPVMGGFILGVFDWHAIFWLRIPIGITALFLALMFIRNDEGIEGPRRLDIPGSVLLFVALSGSLLAVNRGQAWGWTSPLILSLFAVGAIALVAFVRVELRSPSPVVSMALLRVRGFSVSVTALILNFIGQSSVVFLIPFYLIQVRDFSTAHTGFVVATVPAMMLLLSSISGWAADRFAFRYQTTVGAVLVTIGLASLTTLGHNTPDASIIARLALVGVGTAIFGAPNASAIMGSVPRTMLGTASASVGTARNIGNATGLAMAGAVMIGVATSSAGISGVPPAELPDDALLDGIRVAFAVSAAGSALAAIATTFRGPLARPEVSTAASTATPGGGR